MQDDTVETSTNAIVMGQQQIRIAITMVADGTEITEKIGM